MSIALLWFSTMTYWAIASPNSEKDVDNLGFDCCGRPS
jgi:hypothetical protein